MGWEFEQLQQGTLSYSNVAGSCFDGRDAWFLSYSGVNAKLDVFNNWDQNTNYEYLDQNYYFDNTVQSLSAVATVDLSSYYSSGWLLSEPVFWYDSVWVLITDHNTNNKLLRINTTTHTVTSNIAIPFVASQFITCANNKVFVVSYASTGYSTQSIYYYDIIAGTWSSGNVLSGKPQISPARKLIDGLNGYVYVTAHNDHSIIAIDTTTGAVGTSYRINRHPYALAVNSSKDVFIASDAQTDVLKGMVSKFEQATYTSTPFAVALGELGNLQDNEKGFLWYGGKVAKLGRVRKSDTDTRYVGGAALGFSIDLSSLISNPNANTNILSTKSITYQKWNGTSFDTITVQPYLFFTVGTNVYAARDTAMIRKNSIDALGTGMISIGTRDFYGDLV